MGPRRKSKYLVVLSRGVNDKYRPESLSMMVTHGGQVLHKIGCPQIWKSIKNQFCAAAKQRGGWYRITNICISMNILTLLIINIWHVYLVWIFCFAMDINNIIKHRVYSKLHLFQFNIQVQIIHKITLIKSETCISTP